jgi:HlyD family secretion protein
MKTFIGVLTLAGVLAGIYFLNDLTRDEDGKSILNVAGELPITVKIAEPVRRTITRKVDAPGEVEACFEVDISSELVAKILEMPVEEGDTVEEGDLLCRLDDADYRARLQAAEASVGRTQAALTQAQADYDKAERDFLRQKRLAEEDATSALELADYHTNYIRSKARLEMTRHELIQAESAVESATEDLAKTVIESPIDGVISQLFAKQGEVVVTGTMNNPGTRIMVISDFSKMQVRCRVDESDVPMVEPGQHAEIFLQSDMYDGIPGHVLRVAAKGTKPLGRDVVTFETLILVDSDDPRVKPGMNANVQIEVDQKEDALTIPVQAVVQRKKKDLPEEIIEQIRESAVQHASESRRAKAQYVKIAFVKNGEKAEVRLLETGISDDTDVEILAGIEEGDTVVTGPFRSLDQLKAGSMVKLEEAEKKDQGKDKKGEAADSEGAPTEEEEPDADASGEPESTADNESATKSDNTQTLADRKG